MPDQVLQDIKDRLNVVDVLSSYIQLKKAGVNFKAPCPFHNEKTPSLVVSPQKQIWHCFGCGEGGDVFGFVMKYENVEFREALKILANRAGVELPKFPSVSKEQEDQNEKLYRINDFAARFYHEILMKDRRGKEGLEYLRGRGLSDETLRAWNIGYAPDEFHALEQALLKKNAVIADLVAAGVSTKNERGQVYDRFRGRVTFPILDYQGRTVGFSARVLPGADEKEQAKYVNSPETAIYNKSKVVFGLYQAKTAIRKSGEAVLVEGQMDCITPHQAGFQNVIATSGTALTEQQLALIGRLTKQLKFCFDNDSAGQEAARRGGELALQQGFRLKMIQLKPSADMAHTTGEMSAGEEKKWAKDPDELIKKSPGLWEKAVREAVWFVDYYVDLAKTKVPDDAVGQIHYVSTHVVPLLGLIQDPLEQDHYVRRITETFGITETAVRSIIRTKSTPSVPVGPAAAQQSPQLVLEKELLGGFLAYPEFLAAGIAHTRAEEFEIDEIREMVAPAFAGQGFSPATLSNTLAKEAQFMVESMVTEHEYSEEAAIRELEKTLARFKLQAIRKSQQRLSAEIAAAQTQGNKQHLETLGRKFADLSKDRLEWEQKL